MAQKSKYILRTWNGKYGNAARFIVQDTVNSKNAEYAPSRPKDLAWVSEDLTKIDEYKGWQSFENEPLDSLEDVVF